MNEKKSDDAAGAVVPDPQAVAQPGQPEKLAMPNLEKAVELLGKLEEKEKMLLDREAALDKKIKQFDTIAAEARVSGFAVVRQEEPKNIQRMRAAKNMFKGTGLDPYPDLK